MVLKVSNFDIWSVVKVSFVISFVLIFIISFLVFFMISSAVNNLGKDFDDQFSGRTNPFHYARSFGGALLFFFLIFYSLLLACFQTFIIALTFWLYNVLSGYIGEIKVTVIKEELEADAEDQSPVRTE